MNDLAKILAEKTAEIEALGLCHWKYACPYCLAGFIPIRSSVTDAMVHPDSPVGRILCEGRNKPTVLFGREDGTFEFAKYETPREK